ncbi:MAG: hypothetical protein FWC03_09240 [Treponema sp.]|nr:hypothetical protein [Treponema sp.]
MKKMVKFIRITSLIMAIWFSLIGCDINSGTSGTISGIINLTGISNPLPDVFLTVDRLLDWNGEWFETSVEIKRIQLNLSGASGGALNNLNWSINLSENDGFVPGDTYSFWLLVIPAGNHYGIWIYLDQNIISTLDYNAGFLGNVSVRTVTISGTIIGDTGYDGIINVHYYNENDDIYYHLGHIHYDLYQNMVTFFSLIRAPDIGEYLYFSTDIWDKNSGEWITGSWDIIDPLLYTGQSSIMNLVFDLTDLPSY